MREAFRERCDVLSFGHHVRTGSLSILDVGAMQIVHSFAPFGHADGYLSAAPTPHPLFLTVHSRLSECHCSPVT